MGIKRLLNPAGFSLVEALVASTMVVTAAVTVGYFISGTKTTSISNQGNSACRLRAQYVVDRFKGSDNKISMSNWHSEQGIPFPSPSPWGHAEKFIFPIAQPSPGTSFDFGSANGWELIDSGVNWALALYNTGHFCSAGPPFSSVQRLSPTSAPATAVSLNGWGPGNQLYPTGTALTNEAIYLNIQRVDMTTNIKDCLYAGTLHLPPLGTVNGSQTGALSPKTGLFLTATVQFSDNSGTPEQCAATTLLKTEGDSVPAAIIPPPTDLFTGPCPGTFCICKPGSMCLEVPTGSQVSVPPPMVATCGGSKLFFSHAVSEPGAVMACEVDYSTTQTGLPKAPTGNYFPCTSFNVGYVTGTVIKSHSEAIQNDNITGVRIQLTGLIDGYYAFFVAAYDSAQNPSTVASFWFHNTVACVAPSPTPFPSPGPTPFPCDCSLAAGGAPWVSNCQSSPCSTTGWTDIPNGNCGLADALNCCCHCPLNPPIPCP